MGRGRVREAGYETRIEREEGEMREEWQKVRGEVQ